MQYKIVTDSSSNLHNLEDLNITVIPLKITTNNKAYQDTTDLDILNLVKETKHIENIEMTTSVNDWLEAFGDADMIFGITFTSHYSNSFKVAREAKQIYEQLHPTRKVFIIDSLSIGPEIQLMITKLKELIQLKKSYHEIRNIMMDYRQKTHLFFCASHIHPFENYGRINPAIGKRAIHLGYKILGKANFEGNLVSTRLCLGQKNTFKQIIEEMKSSGYQGGRLVISHTNNEKKATLLHQLLTESFGNIPVVITNNRGLCSYFSKKKGIFIAFEA